jgi:hypothetical protein
MVSGEGIVGLVQRLKRLDRLQEAEKHASIDGDKAVR